MDQTMTPLKIMTTGQIDKAVAQYRAMLEKHAPCFGVESVQQALGNPNLTQSQFELFRSHVEAVSHLIVRRVRVNRELAPQQVLGLIGRQQYVNHEVAVAMPRGAGEEIEVVFFKLGRQVSDAELSREYALRNLVPADPYSLAAVNEADPAFADDYSNGTQWKDARGNWCFAAFVRWGGKRFVYIVRCDFVWNDDWWFAGLRKA